MAAHSAIHIERINKSYGDFRAVSDLSFAVQHGEIFALLGPNGAGKSTTIRMILDIIQPDSGRIAVFGAPLTDAARNRIGYLPEERGLYKSVPVLEMLVYLGRLKGLSGSEAKKRGLALLERFELAEYARKKVSDLSKGMQQKVQFAVTILHEPDLIIIDEPFSGLDPVNRLVIKNLLLEFRQRGGAVVMSTHQMNQVEEMADRMLMISRGQQKLYGPVDDIRRQFALHAIIVQGSGDWSALPGVVRVEPGSNGRDGVTLHLAEKTTADDVLAEIARSRNTRIEKFELAIPSLEDIFIRVAGKDGGQ
ncbi:MAG: ATP-binding cassette domain-containing protein [Anaerolineae bacterium]|jgi:ABC-2 type transport system ATP-binding protein|nr:ATP-binding cassette domain-containing protein [Anaerolineae bacterium]